MSSHRLGDEPNHRFLTSKQASEIYFEKISILMSTNSSGTLKGQSTHIAPKFGVSPKTVRDIWNRRTWQQATCHLWATEQSYWDAAAGSALIYKPLQVNATTVLFSAFFLEGKRCQVRIAISEHCSDCFRLFTNLVPLAAHEDLAIQGHVSARSEIDRATRFLL